MIPSKDQLAEGLRLSGLPESAIPLRVEWLTEDLAWIGFEQFNLILSPLFINSRDAEPIPLVEYSFGSTQFDVNNAKSSNAMASTSIGGSAMNRGSLSMLSQVSEIGRRLIPSLWLTSEGLRTYLRNPHWHLDKLNEIWWLGRFPALEVKDGFILEPGTDVDWRFRLAGCEVPGTHLWINLEVKNRPSDASRIAFGSSFSIGKAVANVRSKFHVSPPNELNVLAVTLFGPIDRSVQLGLEKWLSQQEPAVIDAVFLWSYSPLKGKIFDCHLQSSKAKCLKFVVIPPSDIDDEINGCLHHPLPRHLWPQELRDCPLPGL